MPFIYNINNGIIKIMSFITAIILFIKLLNFNVNYKKIKLKDNLQKNSKVIYNFPFIKNQNEISVKKLAIVLLVDSKIYKKKVIYKTLKSILSLNYNYSLYLIYNKKCPKLSKDNIIYIKEAFNNVFIAFNLILDSINDYDYITFLRPGDLIKPTTYDFLYYIKAHDIYQIYEFNKNSFYEKIVFKEKNFSSNIKIYDLVNKMPNNNYVIYDKIYKISLLKNNDIKFIIHEKSQYYFNLLAFSYAKDLLYIDSYGIFHNINIPLEKFIFNRFQEILIFKKIISANKNLTKKNFR